MLINSHQNYFKKLFVLVLCAAVALLSDVSVAKAQNGILADGNPPLTNSMITRLAGLFEWSLEIELSVKDRARLQEMTVGYWKTNDAKSIQSILGSLAFEQKMQSWSDAQKREVQPRIKEKLLENFEQNPSDEMSDLLLTVYRLGQNNDSTNAAANLNERGASVATLAGKWQVLHGNSIVGVDINSGRIGDGNAMIAEYDIRSDGRVIHSFVLQQSNYGCTTRLKTSKTGRATVSGSRVTFAYDGGTTVSEDNCNAKYNYTKRLPAERETFDFSLERKDGKMNFCFANTKIKDCALKIK